MPEVNHIETDIRQIKADVSRLTIETQLLTKQHEKQSNSIDKISTALDKLSVFIERTDQHSKEIELLRMKVDKLQQKGTSNCPVHAARINEIERTLKDKIDQLTKIMMTIGFILVTQIVSFLFYLFEHKIL